MFYGHVIRYWKAVIQVIRMKTFFLENHTEKIVVDGLLACLDIAFILFLIYGSWTKFISEYYICIFDLFTNFIHNLSFTTKTCRK